MAELQVAEVLIAPRAPWQNPYVERLIGSIRSKCLDHVIVFGEAHLRSILGAYIDYYHGSRTHLSLDKAVSAEFQDPNRREMFESSYGPLKT